MYHYSHNLNRYYTESPDIIYQNEKIIKEKRNRLNDVQFYRQKIQELSQSRRQITLNILRDQEDSLENYRKSMINKIREI